MWLKFAQDDILNQIPALHGKPWREIGSNELEEHEDSFPWMKEYYDETGQPIPHSSPWHQETLIEHIRMVPQEIKAMRQYTDNPLLADILGIAGVFHDHWKVRTRAPKNKYECTNCKRMSDNASSPCVGCGGSKSQHPIQVMGYHGHESQGALDENLFPRLNELGIPESYWRQIQLLIKHHLTMHEILNTIQDEKEIGEETAKKWKKIFSAETGFPLKDKIRMSVILAIGDDLGRRSDVSVRMQELFENRDPQVADDTINKIVSKIIQTIENIKEKPQKTKVPLMISDDKKKLISEYLLRNNVNIQNIPSTKNELMAKLSEEKRTDLIQDILQLLI